MVRFVTILACLVGVVGWTPAASAQTSRPERPYRGLFGSGVNDATQSLVVNASIGGGYDDNILLDLPGNAAGDPRAAQSGGIGSANGSLSYSVNGDQGTFGSSFGTVLRYYPGQADPYVKAHNGNVGGNLRLGRRTSLAASQAVAYQPYTFSSIFPTLFDPELGQLDEPRIDQATSRAEFWAYSTTASLSVTASPRVTLNAGYNLTRSDTAYVSNGRFTNQGANGGIRFGLSRNLGLRLGYGRQEARYPGAAGRVQNHNIDAGVDFNKALSFSRRTTLNFSTGTTAVNSSATTSYQATGQARLNHEMGRTWVASAGYNRSVQFLDVLMQPVLSDAIDVGVNGLVNRRVQVQSGLRASIGTTAFGGRGGNDFDTMQAGATVSVALTRFMQLGTTYTFFRYKFDEGAMLPTGVARNIDRQSIRAQLSLWAPVLNRARR